MCWFSLKWREGDPVSEIPRCGAGIFKGMGVVSIR